MPGFVLAEGWAIWKMLRQFRPNVVHAHWLLPQGLIIALLLGGRKFPPFLVTSHGADLFALRSWPLPALKRLTSRRATAVTTVSKAMAEELRRLGVAGDKISVQPMGVDLRTRFTLDPAVPCSRDEILFVGRLVEKKGLRYLIDAMPLILQTWPRAFLTIAGFGPELWALRQQVQALGLDDKVNFLGGVPQPQLPVLYRRAAVFVAPFIQAASGDQERLGLVTVEAIGCGCPAIVSDMPATRELRVMRVKPGDSGALAQRLAEFLAMSDHEREAIAHDQHSAIGTMDWHYVARGYSDSLLRLAQASCPDQYCP